MSKTVRAFEAKSVRLGKLAINLLRGAERDAEVRFFWEGGRYRLAVRFGRKGWRPFSERNRINADRYHYMFGKRVTIIRPRREQR